MNTSLAFSETLKSSKLCFLRISMWRSADSTSASAFGSPYLVCSSASSEPALTPMRIGTPWWRAQAITSATLASLPMLPGLMRRQSAPISAALSAHL